MTERERLEMAIKVIEQRAAKSRQLASIERGTSASRNAGVWHAMQAEAAEIALPYLRDAAARIR